MIDPDFDDPLEDFNQFAIILLALGFFAGINTFLYLLMLILLDRLILIPRIEQTISQLMRGAWAHPISRRRKGLRSLILVSH